MTIGGFQNQANEWGRDKVPFLFIVDFEGAEPVLLKLNDVPHEELAFNFKGITNCDTVFKPRQISFEVNHVPFHEFKFKFDKVMEHLDQGDSFLTNLTFKSQLNGRLNLQALFHASLARYKMCMKNRFLFFSPETFIQIEDGLIRTFPMKGTIDAAIQNAEQVILNDEKEMAEHITIVDLLRNDLSQVSSSVVVKRFRYIDRIKTSNKTILQVSSEVAGRLARGYENKLGDILVQLLPAGSISGAPKKRTVEIINEVEGEPRGYYTGVAGYFDGNKLDSCVMIRFIEQKGDHFYYRSGGGITSRSDAQKEYLEMKNKIYVPVA